MKEKYQAVLVGSAIGDALENTRIQPFVGALKI